MGKGKRNALKRSVLALLIAMTCFTAFTQPQKIDAKIVFDIKEKITYQSDYQGAEIAFDTKVEDVTLMEIINPDGTNMDLFNPVFTVNQNGSYTFMVKYSEAGENGEISEQQLEKTVIVSDIKVKESVAIAKTPSLIQPKSNVSDGGVNIDIPDYDGIGWSNGNIKDVNVTVDFGDQTSTDKKLIVNVPEGMRYELISIKDGTDKTGVDSSILSVYSSSEPLATGIASMILPKKETAPMGATYGKIEYTFIPGTKVVTINLKVSVDMSRYYGVHAIAGKISAKAYKGIPTQEVGDVEQTVSAIGSTIGTGNVTYSLTGSEELLPSTPSEVSKGMTPAINIALQNQTAQIKNRFAKNIVMELYYPLGMEFDRLSVGGYTILEDDQANGRVVVKYNTWKSESNTHLFYRVPIGMADGTYTSKATDKVTYTWYDGSEKTVNRTGGLHKVKVSSSIVNSMKITSSSNLSMDSTIDNHVMFGPNFAIGNKSAGVKTNQVAEFVIDPNWQVFRVQLPFDKSIAGNKITDIEYKTNKNASWRSYVPTTELTTDSLTKVLTKEEVGLDSDEFFISVKANVGSFSVNFLSGNYISTKGHISTWGSLKQGSTSANVTFSIYDKDDRSSTEQTSTKSVSDSATNRKISSNARTTFKKNNVTSSTLVAGDSFEMQTSINVGEHEPLYETVHALENPEIYLREPVGMKIAVDTIKIKDASNQNVTWTYSTHVNTFGDTIYKIKTQNTKIGNYFNETLEKKVLNIAYTVATEVSLFGNFDARELISWGKPGTTAVSTYPQSPATDIYDFNGNNDVNEKLLSVYSNVIKVAENKNVLVETFLSLAGENPKGPYVEGDSSTLAYFTPGTDADYSVKVTNNGDVPADSFDSYIPIPKTGANFGSAFQSEAFKWDMTLKGAIVSAPGFDVLYSSDATSANYNTTAIYSATPPANLNDVKMVKIIATTPVPAKDEAEFKVPLKVNETFESATAGNKITTKNVYNPVYEVVSTSFVGTLPGTKAGTELVIAEIGGIVFEDKNGDGLYKAEDGDTLIKDHEVELYKHNSVLDIYEPVRDASNQPIKTKTNSNGIYNFDYTTGMGYGDYAVRFVEKSGANYEYTIHNTSDRSIDSDAIISGPNRGWVLNIDPTKPIAKTIGCGFLKYNPPVDLQVSVNSSPNSVKVGNTINVGRNISPDFWDNIKDQTTPYTWEIVGSVTEKAKANLSVGSDGSVTITPNALASGTTNFQLQLTIQDVYGNTKTSAPVTITVISNTPPMITAPEMVTYVGDSANVMSGVSATDNEGNAITLITAPGVTQNTTITHNIPVSNGKYNTAGTYEVEYKVKDQNNNEETKTRIVKVNTLPVIIATSQTYELGDANIQTSVSGNVSGSYLKASDSVGQATVETTLVPSYTIKSGASSDFSVAGIYKVEYTVSTPEGKQAKQEVDVVIKPKGAITKDDVLLSANNFTLENAEAAGLSEGSAKSKANVLAIKTEKVGSTITGYTDITNKVSVNVNQLNVIKTVPAIGGIYDLKYTVIEGSTSVEKTIKVVVKGSNTPEPNELAISAKNMSITHVQALALSGSEAKNSSEVKAILLSDNSEITNINVDVSELAAINDVSGTGGTFNLTFTAVDGSESISTSIQIVVAHTLVKPVVSTNDCEHYVGDSVNMLHGLVGAVDYDGTSVSIDATEITGNTKVVQSVPMSNNKLTTPGTYEVTYKVKDSWGNEGESTKKVKVHGLPTIKAEAQTYQLDNANIKSHIGEHPIASWKKASDSVGNAAEDTIIAGPAVELSQATSEPVTYEVISGPNGNLNFSEVGIYEVEYVATNPDNRTVSKRVPVLIVPNGIITEPTETLSIHARGFTVENSEAKNLTETLALDQNHGNAVAFKTERDNLGNILAYTDVSTKVTVSSNQLTSIKKAPKTGGIYDLTYEIEDNGISVRKIVKVVVKGSGTPPPVVTPDGNELAITAKDFTLTYDEAKKISEDEAIVKANAEAHLLNENPNIARLRVFTNTLEVSLNNTQLTAIQNVGKAGGSYDLTFKATYTDANNAVTTTQVVVKVNVSKQDKKQANSIGTSDNANITNYLFLLIVASSYFILRKRIKD